MKTIHHIFTALLGLALSSAFVSCSDFLDMQPTNSSNSQGAINTLKDAEVVLNGVMGSMTSSSYYGRNMFLYGDTRGGDVTIYAAGRGYSDLYTFNHSASSGSYSGYWTRGFYCLLQINTLIQEIERCIATGVNDDFSYIHGQALALRALVNFDLTRIYGAPYNMNKNAYGIPDVDKPLGAESLPGRATVEQNYKRMTDDLATAIGLMAADKKPRQGYIDYYGALALQARIKLYMEDYDGALASAKEIIDNGPYSLYSNDDWAASWSRQFGSESIFELAVTAEEADLKTNSLGFCYIRYQHLKSAMGLFIASDYFLNLLGEDPDDVRWGVMDNDEYWLKTGTERKGACYKYIGGLAMNGDGKSTATAVNIKIIRLSEVYLIAAEAALHSGQHELAAEYLNHIRRRSPSLEPATASTISDNMILDERSKELYGEGHRFFDMIRMNRQIEFNDDFQDVPVAHREKTIDRTFYKIILPIDIDELNVNPTIREQQNPGY